MWVGDLALGPLEMRVLPVPKFSGEQESFNERALTFQTEWSPASMGPKRSARLEADFHYQVLIQADRFSGLRQYLRVLVVLVLMTGR